MAESLFGKLQNGAVGFFTLVATIVGATVYGVNMKNDFDSAKAKVVQLETQVSELRLQLSNATKGNGLQGIRGEPGPIGPAGPRGDAGPPGDRGPAGANGHDGISQDEAQRMLSAMVEKAISDRSNLLGRAAFSPSETAQPVVFDSSKCVMRAEAQTAAVLSITKGVEFCEDDGSLLATYKGLNTNRPKPVMTFAAPGQRDWTCNSTQTCEFNWLSKRTFVLERWNEQDGQTVVTLRFTDKR